MLDIIIPYYNNKDGLSVTLQSIPKNKDITVTIIDDHSPEILKDINAIRLPQNVGPGNARQYGIENTKEPYIMFIDTGDYFLDNVFDNVLSMISSYPEVNIFSWQHIIETTKQKSADTHNRLHARVYKRNFILQNNITFCKESSYVNEDVGFNRICRMLTEFKFIPNPIYVWTYDKNSLTKRNNEEFIYQKQNIGLALNGIHIYNSCKNKVPFSVLEQQCCEIMGALHYNFIRVAQERVKDIKYAWDGAKLFYNKVWKPNNFSITNSLYQVFGKTLQEARKKRDIWRKLIPINIQRFLQDLEKYENVPNWYIK